MLVDKAQIAALHSLGFDELAEALPMLLENKPIHGHQPQWQTLIDSLPEVQSDSILADTVSIGEKNNLSIDQRNQLEEILQGFCPWRKGPYSLFGIHIDSEWRSDLKWQRIAPHLKLNGKRILDIGCANGYFGWRMLAAGAKGVLGIDPSQLYVKQFELINHFINSEAHMVLPLAYEDVDDLVKVDIVFSLGVIYHRKDPIDHLLRIKENLVDGGELVIESLVVDDKYSDLLIPRDRYAQMRNVWNIPSVGNFAHWLDQAGFKDIRLLDVNVTTTEEQRSTKWMPTHSLIDFLDKEDTNLTVELYPRPQRAIYFARKV